jgi:hypothetical protein
MNKVKCTELCIGVKLHVCYKGKNNASGCMRTGCFREGRKQQQRVGANFIMGISTIRTSLQILISLYSFTALLLDLGRFFSFLILYTFGRTPWTGDQPFARPLPTHRINGHRHPCLEWDSNPRSQRSSEGRQYMP